MEGTKYNFISGATAGVVSSLLIYPLELVRTRMALRGEMRKFGIMGIIKNTYKQEGLLGLYKGSSIAVIGVLTYKGLGFTFYEEMKKLE